MDAARLIHAPRGLSTPRLQLHSPLPAHAAAVCESVNASLPALRFIHWAQTPWDLARAEAFCARGQALVAAGDCLIFNAFRRTDGAFIGRVDLHSFDFDTPRAEIGYVGDVRHAGQGLMLEAVRAVLGLAFALGFVRVQALSEADNHRALHFAEAVGLRPEGVLRHYERDAQGRLGDQVILAMLAGELGPAEG